MSLRSCEKRWRPHRPHQGAGAFGGWMLGVRLSPRQVGDGQEVLSPGPRGRLWSHSPVLSSVTAGAEGEGPGWLLLDYG